MTNQASLTTVTALEARHVSKRYPGDEQAIDALRDVDVAVARGEMVAVTGPSGSGKSTLLHLLGGLDSPTEGEVVVDGQQLSNLSPDQLASVRNRKVGFVFQLFNLLPTLTVEENVALPAVIARRRPAQYRQRAEQLLESVGLASKCRRFPAQLSGGEQQRVALARALVMDPPVLLADEPTGNLDTRAGAEVLSLLRHCHGEGRTVVIVTHDARVAAQTQRVIYLRDGRVADQTPLVHTLGRPAVRMIEIEDPDQDPLPA